MIAGRWWRAAAALAYPPVCALCQAARIARRGEWCETCRDALVTLPAPWCPGCGGTLDGALTQCAECLLRERPWRQAISVYDFGGLARTVVHRFKYRGDVALARPLGAAVAAAWRARHLAPPAEVVIPVPLHPWRQLRRTYNQAELLVQEVGRLTGLPCGRGLRRTRWTAPQARLSQAERQANLRHAFAPVRDFPFAGKRVLLCDDVLTTGATLQACTHELLRAGALSVDVLTIARG